MMPIHTTTGLKRWSCQNSELPAVNSIKTIHVYDFDNTLFLSPSPNPGLWGVSTIGRLGSQDCFLNGGWWHDPGILKATGEGIEKEEARGYQGWWSEQIVKLCELSTKQKDAISVLLTGRSEHGFADLIKRIIRSRNLSFDLIVLKPHVGPNNQKFESTMDFKRNFLKDLMYTYTDANDIRIYEDRPKHVTGFRKFLEDFNERLLATPVPISRKTITGEVILVIEEVTYLDPVTETAEVQRMINQHNTTYSNMPKNRHTYMLKIKRTVLSTAYLISQEVTDKLVSFVKLPSRRNDTNMRYLANSIIITTHPWDQKITEKAGPIGSKVRWRVNGVSVYENKVWAARVEPIPSDTPYYTENSTPVVILALSKGATTRDASQIRDWQPVPAENAIEFDSIIGERALLSIDNDEKEEGGWGTAYLTRPNKRRHTHEELEHQRQFQHTKSDFGRNNGGKGPSGSQQNFNFRQHHPTQLGRSKGISGHGGSSHRGNGNGGRGGVNGANHRGTNNRGGAGSGRGGRGGGARYGGYRSLDEIGTADRNHLAAQSYDDSVPLRPEPAKEKAKENPRQNQRVQHPQKPLEAMDKHSADISKKQNSDPKPQMTSQQQQQPTVPPAPQSNQGFQPPYPFPFPSQGSQAPPPPPPFQPPRLQPQQPTFSQANQPQLNQFQNNQYPQHQLPNHMQPPQVPNLQQPQYQPPQPYQYPYQPFPQQPQQQPVPPPYAQQNGFNFILPVQQPAFIPNGQQTNGTGHSGIPFSPY